VTVVADALFDFDKSVLRNDAVETLTAVGPEIAKAGKHPLVVEGYTDAIGSDAYNLKLSEERARAVRDWLARQGFIGASARNPAIDGGEG
jgi:OOP family OmpA-OmpF porin